MYKAISAALLLGGVALLVFGNNAMNSFSSDIARIFTGAPTDKAVWMLAGGLVMTVVGLVGLIPWPKD